MIGNLWLYVDDKFIFDEIAILIIHLQWLQIVLIAVFLNHI